MRFSSRLKVAVIHPTGNQFARHLIGTLATRDRLGVFATTLAFSDEKPVPRWLPVGLRSQLMRRFYDLPETYLWRWPAREGARLVADRLGWDWLTRHESGPFCVDEIYRGLDEAVARSLSGFASTRMVKAVYGYEDGCEKSFERAKEVGMTCFYDLPIAYWETACRLLREEGERWPQWKPTMLGLEDSPRKRERKVRELQLADVVFCPSSFVADSLPAWAAKSQRIVLAPFGSPSEAEDGGERDGPAPGSSAKLRVLFAGSLGQRKGLADLFEAMRLLRREDIELVVLGAPIARLDFYRRQYADFIYEPTRPHDDVLRLMRTCHVFALPSIVEGRALVVQEAMSQSLPVLITANTGAADLVEEGRTGFLVPIRSPEALAEKLAWCADHRPELREMGVCARKKAAECSWEAYESKIAGIIEETLPT